MIENASRVVQVGAEEMNTSDNDLVETVAGYLIAYGALSAGEVPHSVAEEWITAGFDDSEEIEDWLKARCFSATSAAQMEDFGITPQQAAFRTSAGNSDYEDTIAFKVANRDLSLEEARRIINSEFWNR
jgi:hypothetical protein